MNWKRNFYDHYRTWHTEHCYGEIAMDDIRKQFPVWERYYRDFLPNNRDAEILDVGCGNGGFVWWLSEIGYRNAVGIDISHEEIERGMSWSVPHIYEADLTDFLRIRANVYRVLFLRDVLEHFSKEEILRVLALSHASLMPGGRCIIKMPNAASPFSGQVLYGDFTHETNFTERSVRQALLASEFQRISVYPARPVIHGIKSFVRSLLWRGIEGIFMFCRLIETGDHKGLFTQAMIAVAQKGYEKK